MEYKIKYGFSKIIGYICFSFFSLMIVLFLTSSLSPDEYWALGVILFFALLGLAIPKMFGEVLITDEKIRYQNLFGTFEILWKDVLRVETDHAMGLGFIAEEGYIVFSAYGALLGKDKEAGEFIFQKFRNLEIPIEHSVTISYKLSKGVRVKK